jgi:hypothetical protein
MCFVTPDVFIKIIVLLWVIVIPVMIIWQLSKILKILEEKKK